MAEKNRVRIVYSYLRMQAKTGLFILFFIVANACEDPGSIGEDFIINEPVNLYYLDTVSVKFSTVQLDSIVTSTLGTFLTGYHEDERLGNISAKGFFRVGLDSIGSTTIPGSTAAYKNVVLRLEYDDYAFYDTTGEVSLSVYQLAEEIVLDEDTDALYNTSSFSLSEDDRDSTAYVGRHTFIPYPKLRDYVEIPLDEWLGKELFHLVKEEDDILEELNDFLDAYPGFALVPDQTSGSILRFSTSSRLVINYIEGGEDEKLVFPINNQYHFTQISSDREHTQLNGLDYTNTSVASETSDNEAYLQAGAGLAIRIDFPFLKQFKEVETKDILTQSYLTLGVVKNSYSKNRPLPETLLIYVVDHLNRVVSEYSAQTSLVLDKEFGENTQYNILITSFLESQLSVEQTNEYALLILLPTETFYSSVDRLVIGNKQNDFRSLLKLYMLNYKTSY